MNHEAARERLDAYLDRELSSADRAGVETHLVSCEACREELVELEALAAAARALPTRIDPRPEVWKAVRSGIDSTVRTGRRSRPPGEPFVPGGFLRAAVAAAAAVAVFWAGARLVPPAHRVDPEGPSALRGPGGPGDPGTGMPDLTVLGDDATPRASEWARMIWALEEQSLGADKVLAATLKDTGHPKAAAQASAVLPGLRALDEAIDETTEALRRNPGDPGLARALAGHYERRLSLVRLAVRIAQESWT